METGLTPLDAALSFTGQLFCARLMSNIAPLLAIIAGIGILYYLYLGLAKENGSLLPVTQYIFYVIILIAVFVVPQTSISADQVVSFAEKDTSTAQAAAVAYRAQDAVLAREGSALTILRWIDQAMNDIIAGCVKVMDLVTLPVLGKEKSYFQEPFGAINSAAALMATHFDAGTAQKVRDFIPLHKKAISILVQDKKEQIPEADQKIGNRNLYVQAGDDTIISAWDALESDMNTWAETKKKDLNMPNMTDGELINIALRNMEQSSGFELHATGITADSSDFLERTVNSVKGVAQGVVQRGQEVLNAVAWNAAGWINSILTNIIIPALPALQGLSILIAYALFPLILCVALLPGKENLLGEYFFTLFWIKSWHLGWALVHTLSEGGESLTNLISTAHNADPEAVRLFANSIWPVACMFGLVMVPSIMYILIRGRLTSMVTMVSRAEGAAGKATGAVT